MNIFKNEALHEHFMSIYDQTEQNNDFHVCRYLCSDDTHVLFQSISTRGFDNGLYLIPVDYIYRVDVDDAYTRSVEQLFHLQNQSTVRKIHLNKEDSVFMYLLRYTKNKQLVTTLFTETQEDITGWISNIDMEQNVLVVEQLTQFGERDGTVYLDIDSINKIISDSGVERCIQMLNKESKESNLLSPPKNPQ